MLCCLGDLLEDIVVLRPEHIRTGADTHVRITRRRGGSAANTAVAAARLGRAVRFIGQVGDDAVGRALVDSLEQEGVDARVQVGGRSGTIVVLVDDDADRTMLGDRGAAGELDRLEPGDLDDVRWLHVPAYSLVGEPVGRIAAEALLAVRRAGASTSIDVSSLTLLGDPGRFRDMLCGLRPEVVFANEVEFAALGDDTTWLTDDTVLVVKRGRGPASVLGSDGEIATRDAQPLGEVSDTTGAGDAFAAGFIHARMSAQPFGACLEAGHASAATWITPH